uniref:Uncharacterized protein n=1 Tax=Ciona intestinalis TaxID=7719 RepID=F6ZJ04_CIOIN
NVCVRVCVWKWRNAEAGSSHTTAVTLTPGNLCFWWIARLFDTYSSHAADQASNKY